MAMHIPVTITRRCSPCTHFFFKKP